MKLRVMGLVAVAAALLSALGVGGSAWAQAPDAAAVARGSALFKSLGCESCHGAPGAGGTRKGKDLSASALPRIADAEVQLSVFMGKSHPFVNDRSDRSSTLTVPIATVSQQQAADILTAVRGVYSQTRLDQGRAEAPALIAASGAPCTMTEALYNPISEDKKAKTKVDAYELVCSGAVGRVIIKTDTAGAAAYEVRDCLTASAPQADGSSNPVACRLPANADVVAQLKPYVANSGATCDLKQARALGSTADATYIEAACAGDRGYVLGLPKTLDPTKDVTARDCLAQEPGASTECKLISREAMLAAAVDPLVAVADKACAIKGRRYVAASQGDTYYEVACASGTAFMVAADFRGGLKTKVACANAEGIAGGCTLTDAKAIQTADNARYAALAKAAGYDCAVSGYRPLAATEQDETVEMACSNRADGAVALFPKAGAARVFNCAAAETTGYRCSLSSPEATYPRLTAVLKRAYPATTCQVSASRFIGVTPEAGFVEVACADKAPGYIVQYAKATAQPTEVVYCSRMRSEAGGAACTLPTNLLK
ncbi:MAG: hypothetical protein BGN86_15760 [Caulobacterales bacterium 68-7]|nr:MAG: hypothetical protein BGN86_15760 [Caulobacterales bacterium 68-7]